MIQIIPAILSSNKQDAYQKVDMVASLVEWVQLDVVDGKFTDSTTWNNPQEVKHLVDKVKVEAHLMVQQPENVMDAWIASGVGRIYIHYESTTQHKAILQKIQAAGIEAGVAILGSTPLSSIYDIMDNIDAVLIFSGSLGHYGGSFQKEPCCTYIRSLRQRGYNGFIEVDGGMNKDTIPMVASEGVDAVVVGSAIFGTSNVEQAVGDLQHVVAGLA